MPTSRRPDTSLLLGGLIIVLLALIVGCSEDDDTTTPLPTGPQEITGTCLGCHTSEADLRATARIDTASGGDDPGEG